VFFKQSVLDVKELLREGADPGRTVHKSGTMSSGYTENIGIAFKQRGYLRMCKSKLETKPKEREEFHEMGRKIACMDEIFAALEAEMQRRKGSSERYAPIAEEANAPPEEKRGSFLENLSKKISEDERRQLRRKMLEQIDDDDDIPPTPLRKR